MERRFAVRLQEMKAEAVSNPEVWRGALPRLEAFVEPFAKHLQRSEQRVNARRYVGGLISNLERKNVESIAYQHDQERQGLQKFIGQSPWDHRPLVGELADQVAAELGQPDGVIVFDPSGFPKKGEESVGVQRQWCGRLGKIENCQVGVYMAYVSRHEHALVDMRLYLPKKWAHNKARRKKCGVPREVRFQTRQELALAMLAERGKRLPHAWVAGDEELGRSSGFRGDLRELGERYLLAVPANTRIRDLAAEPPPDRGSGQRPQVPFQRVDHWQAALPASAWMQVDVRDGEKGPLVVFVATTRVIGTTDKRRRYPPKEELLVVIRRAENGTTLYDYYLSNAPPDTPPAEFARVAKAEHRVEDCFQRAKSEAGLADYEVRSWEGWHHHQTLSLMATWFLTQEARRGKKIHTGLDGPPGSLGPGLTAA